MAAIITQVKNDEESVSKGLATLEAFHPNSGGFLIHALPQSEKEKEGHWWYPEEEDQVVQKQTDVNKVDNTIRAGDKKHGKV